MSDIADIKVDVNISVSVYFETKSRCATDDL